MHHQVGQRTFETTAVHPADAEIARLEALLGARRRVEDGRAALRGELDRHERIKGKLQAALVIAERELAGLLGQPQ